MSGKKAPDPLMLDYEAYHKDNPPAKLSDIRKYVVDPSSYLAGSMGWLRRGHGTMFIGWSGQGKSVLVEQMGVYLAAGLDLWGKIKVFKPIKVLLIENENGMDVIARDIRAIMDHVKANEKLVDRNLVIQHNWKYKDEAFHDYFLCLLAMHKPDLVIVDNYQGHCTSDINKAEVFNAWVEPLLHGIKAANCGFILVDHASKPPKTGHTEKDIDFSLGAYLGSGTGRKANWARTSFELINFASDRRFRLNFSKSGQWAGIKDASGQSVRHFFIEQSGIDEEPYWKLSESQAPVMRGAKTAFDQDEFERLFKKTADMTQADWAKHYGVNIKTIKRAVARLRAKETGEVVVPKKRKSK
jgi:hypothetical protein